MSSRGTHASKPDQPIRGVVASFQPMTAALFRMQIEGVSDYAVLRLLVTVWG